MSCAGVILFFVRAKGKREEQRSLCVHFNGLILLRTLLLESSVSADATIVAVDAVEEGASRLVGFLSLGCLDECGRSGFAKVTDLLPAEGAGFLAEDMHMTSVASRISALVMPGVLLPIEIFLHVASFCAPASFEPPGLVKAARLANPWSGEGATMCMGVPPSTCSVGDPRRCSLSFINDAGDRDGSGVRPIP